jgi:hypothetical protein
MSVPVYACARCGEKERTDNTFLCADCLRSRLGMKERLAVKALHNDDIKAQRRALIERYGWAGWTRRLKGAPRA